MPEPLGCGRGRRRPQIARHLRRWSSGSRLGAPPCRAAPPVPRRARRAPRSGLTAFQAVRAAVSQTPESILQEGVEARGSQVSLPRRRTPVWCLVTVHTALEQGRSGGPTHYIGPWVGQVGDRHPAWSCRCWRRSPTLGPIRSSSVAAAPPGTPVTEQGSTCLRRACRARRT